MGSLMGIGTRYMTRPPASSLYPCRNHRGTETQRGIPGSDLEFPSVSLCLCDFASLLLHELLHRAIHAVGNINLTLRTHSNHVRFTKLAEAFACFAGDRQNL